MPVKLTAVYRSPRGGCVLPVQAGLTRPRISFVLSVVATVVFVLSAAPVLAYDETGSGRTCIECHGQDDGTPQSATESRRRGPHGGYTTGTQKCQTCHVPHDAGNPETIILLDSAPSAVGPTISDTCLTCHDGTGGAGVYGVIRHLDPLAEVSEHRINSGTGGVMAVPMGASDGTTASVGFTGADGGLSCGDCHSAHDSGTVDAFIGDRVRTADDTSAAVASNRLLKRKPTSATTSTAVYGTEWCGGCHKGYSRTGHTHSVSTAPTRYYDKVDRLNAAGTAMDAAPGPLGGSNRGYVTTNAPEPPICQQCHEDRRDVGNAVKYQVSAAETFSPSLDGATPGNPRFQNFPHETAGTALLVEDEAWLCGNCHP